MATAATGGSRRCSLPAWRKIEAIMKAALLDVRMQPGAKQASLQRQADGVWKIRLRARAVEGQANAALVAQLAQWLDVPKSALRIVRGQTGRAKVVEVSGLDAAEIESRLVAELE